MEGCSFHTRHELNQPCFSYIENEAVDDLVTEIAMSHLAALEAQRSLDLVTFTKEPHCLIFLCLVIVFVDGDGKLHLFNNDDLLLFTRGALGLVLLVKELAVILNFADGWDGVRGNLYQIKGSLAGHLESFEGSHDAKLVAVFINNTDFARANALVGTNKGLCRTLIDRWNRSPPQPDLASRAWVGMIAA